MLKILVLGLGYVGTANAVLLSQQNEVTCFDLDISKSKNLINGISPIEDKEVSDSSHESNMKKAIRILAKTPTALAAFYRLRKGKKIIKPKK